MQDVTGKAFPLFSLVEGQIYVDQDGCISPPLSTPAKIGLAKP
jgi:hypothetical protein